MTAVRQFTWTVLLAGLASTGCASVKTDQEVTSRFDPDRIEVDMDRESITRSFQSPLYMLNIKKEDIPDHLPEASETYREPTSCLLARVEYDTLNAILGEDDVEESGEEYSTLNLDAGDAIESAIDDFIPFESVIKYVSGAKKHEKKVASAFFRGQIRRAYLKGYIQRTQCEIPTPVAKPGSPLAERMRLQALADPAMTGAQSQLYVEPGPRLAEEAASAPTQSVPQSEGQSETPTATGTGDEVRTGKRRRPFGGQVYGVSEH